MQERGTRSPLTATRRLGLLASVAAVVVAVDQLTKWWAVSHLADRDVHVVWTLRFALTRNTGAAFSRAAGRGTFVGVAAIAVVVVLIWMGRGLDTRRGAAVLGLVLGGALGNLADRAFRGGSGFLGGAVIDFIDLRWWPVFNVADAAISIGAICLMFVLGTRSTP